MPRLPAALVALGLLGAALPATAAEPGTTAQSCRLTPKDVVARFLERFYGEGKVRDAFMTWVDPGYIQHNPFAATGRDAAIAFLEPFMAAHPDHHAEVKRLIADGPLVAAHTFSRMDKTDPGVAVVDIFRVEGCKVMEHWDVVQPVPAKSANSNTMF